MSTVIVAAILVCIIIGGFLWRVTIAKDEKRKRMIKVLHRFSELGSKHNMTFSSQIILKNCVIGFDGRHRKLLVLRGIDEEKYNASVVDLANVKNCFVKKQYGTIKSGELKKRKLENYLELIVLHFEFIDGKQPVEVPFYQHIENHISELTELEQKAKYWETLLSKMLKMPSIKIATDRKKFISSDRK